MQELQRVQGVAATNPCAASAAVDLYSAARCYDTTTAAASAAQIWRLPAAVAYIWRLPAMYARLAAPAAASTGHAMPRQRVEQVMQQQRPNTSATGHLRCRHICCTATSTTAECACCVPATTSSKNACHRSRHMSATFCRAGVSTVGSAMRSSLACSAHTAADAIPSGQDAADAERADCCSTSTSEPACTCSSVV